MSCLHNGRSPLKFSIYKYMNKCIQNCQGQDDLTTYYNNRHRLWMWQPITITVRHRLWMCKQSVRCIFFCSWYILTSMTYFMNLVKQRNLFDKKQTFPFFWVTRRQAGTNLLHSVAGKTFLSGLMHQQYRKTHNTPGQVSWQLTANNTPGQVSWQHTSKQVTSRPHSLKPSKC